MNDKKSISSTLVLLFFLVVLPLGSYYYLKLGFNYRRDGIYTQEDFGKMPDLSGLEPVIGQLPSQLRGSMTVVGWLNPALDNANVVEAYGQTLDSLYQQFQNSPNLYFTTLVIEPDAAEKAATFSERYHLPKSDMLSFLAVDSTRFIQTAGEFKLPLGPGQFPGHMPVVALVDSSLTVVKHYNLENRDETLSLVQLISLIIPLPEKADIIEKPEKEL